MVRHVLFGLFALLVASSNALAKDPPGEWKSLFNGRDFAGWHGLGHFDPRELTAMDDAQRAAKREADLKDMRQHWTIEGDAFVNDGHGVYLTTDEEYGDIELTLEYKTVALADSGVYLRGSPQVQIWDTTKEGGKWKIAHVHTSELKAVN